MLSWRVILLSCLVLPTQAAGCKPKIGDDCTQSLDCSSSGDRLCDPTQPGGYCTIFNCEPGSCPKEAVCIGFGSVISSAPSESEGPENGWACGDSQSSARLMRTFCMRECDSDKDCRDQYQCLDLVAPGNAYGAVLVEKKGRGRVCATPSGAMEIPADRETDWCSWGPSEYEPTEGEGVDEAARGGAGAGAAGSSGAGADPGGSSQGGAGASGGGAGAFTAAGAGSAGQLDQVSGGGGRR